MTRTTLLLSAAVLALVVGLPLLYADQRHRTYRNFRVVEEGQLYRSGQMSPAGFERVCREKGIRTVIKLREANDEKPADVAADEAEEAYCRANNIRFLRLTPKSWEKDPATGRVPMEENLDLFLALMDDPEQAPRPVLVHCFAGIHRTGAMVAAYRVKYHGWTGAEAVDELKACGKQTSTYVGNLEPFLRGEYLPAVAWRVGGR